MYKNPPLDIIVTWPAPSAHPESRIPIVLGTGIAFSAILAVIVGLRILSRVFVSKAFASDDWMTVLGFVGYLTRASGTPSRLTEETTIDPDAHDKHNPDGQYSIWLGLSCMGY